MLLLLHSGLIYLCFTQYEEDRWTNINNNVYHQIKDSDQLDLIFLSYMYFCCLSKCAYISPEEQLRREKITVILFCCSVDGQNLHQQGISMWIPGKLIHEHIPPAELWILSWFTNLTTRDSHFQLETSDEAEEDFTCHKRENSDKGQGIATRKAQKFHGIIHIYEL